MIIVALFMLIIDQTVSTYYMWRSKCTGLSSVGIVVLHDEKAG